MSVLQRHIDYQSGQFVIDSGRPSFIDSVAKWKVSKGFTSVDHIVPFKTIQNDLCVLLNQFLVDPTNNAEENKLRALHSSLYHSGLPKTHFKYAGLNLENVIKQIKAGATQNYAGSSGYYLSYLNSAPDNLRIGDASLNSSIGENLDVDFNSGSILYSGAARTTAGTQNLVGREVLTLTTKSNTVLYLYLNATPSGMLTFVLDSSNTQLSSVAGPSKSGLPVLVTDPSGGGATPFLFQ